MTSFASKINLNRLTLPQRRYMQHLQEMGGLFKSDKDIMWMTGTREQLIKRNMLEWIMLEGKPALRMTARGVEAMQSANQI